MLSFEEVIAIDHREDTLRLISLGLRGREGVCQKASVN